MDRAGNAIIIILRWPVLPAQSRYSDPNPTLNACPTCLIGAMRQIHPDDHLWYSKSISMTSRCRTWVQGSERKSLLGRGDNKPSRLHQPRSTDCGAISARLCLGPVSPFQVQGALRRVSAMGTLAVIFGFETGGRGGLGICDTSTLTTVPLIRLGMTLTPYTHTHTYHTTYTHKCTHTHPITHTHSLSRISMPNHILETRRPVVKSLCHLLMSSGQVMYHE